MRRRAFSGMVIGVVILAVWVSFHLVEKAVYSEMAPPNGMSTIGEFRSFLPDKPILDVTVDGHQHYVIFGEQPVVLFAEFPAAYLFDSDGKLVSWTPEASDLDPLSQFWNAARVEWQQGRILDYDVLVLSTR